MASNSLLALLNLPSSGASSSRKVSSSSPPPVVSPPLPGSSSTATANTLLQSILSPGLKPQSKPASIDQNITSSTISTPAQVSSQDILAPAHSPTPSTSRIPSTSSRPTSAPANDLLALLSGTGNIRESTEEDEGDTSFHEQTPRSRLQPIGTPPNQSSRKNSIKSPGPSLFDSASLFDMLNQSQVNGNKSAHASGITPKSTEITAEETKPQPLEAVQPIPRVAQPIKTAYTIKRSLHASHHLSGLHASAGFEDGISDGLSALEVDGVQHFNLDLGSPQPAGLSSLYPAKLEITPISLLTTTFAPSCFINNEDEQSGLARWPSHRVAGMGGNVVMYVMSKGRIRVLDQLSGDRILARADSTILSVFTPGVQRSGPLQDNQRMFGAITEKGGLCVWLLKKDFGQSQEDAPLTLHLFAEIGKTFVSVQWLPNREDSKLLVLQSDGTIAVISIPAGQKEYKKSGAPLSWQQCPKTVVAEVDSEGYRPVGLAVSSDGSLAAVVDAAQSLAQGELRLRFFSLLQQQASGTQHSINLPSLAQLGYINVSFTSFVTNGEDQLPRGLLIGFDDNQVIALVDLTTGSLKQVYHFNAPGSSFSLAAWHSMTSSLQLCSSIRSSIFSLRIRFGSLPSVDSHAIAEKAELQAIQELDQSDEILYRIKHEALPCTVLPTQPALRECALPEPYTSFALDNTAADRHSIRLIATHLGGIHAVLLPKEALVQSVTELTQKAVVRDKEDGKEEDGGEIKEATVEVEALASHGNADITAPLAEKIPSPRSVPLATAEEVAPVQRAVTPPPPTVPAMEERKAKASTPKKKNAHKKAEKPMVENIASHSVASSNAVQVSKDANISTEEIKVLFATLESRLMAQIQSRSPSDGSSNVDTAQALADQLAPRIGTMIDEVLGAHLKVAVDSAVSRSLGDELHNALLRPDLSNHLTRSITSSILPPVHKTAMDVVSRVLAPHFETIMSEMADGIEAKISSGLTGIRKDIIMEQSKALLETEANLREVTTQMAAMSRSVGMLMAQNKKLELALEALQGGMAGQSNGNNDYHREAVSTPVPTSIQQIFAGQPPATPSSYTSLSSARNVSFPYSPHYASPPAPYQNRQPSYHAVQPLVAPTLPIPASISTVHQYQQAPQVNPPGMTSQEVEDILLSSLSLPNTDSDITPLQSSLTHIALQCGSPVSAIWNKAGEVTDLGKPRISQAVILTLLHRLIKGLKASAEQQLSAPLSIESTVPWIEACAAALDKNDEVISRYFNHIRAEMTDSLIQCHRLLKSRAYWWTEERLAYGILRFLQ